MDHYEVSYSIFLFDMPSPEEAARAALKVIVEDESRIFLVQKEGENDIVTVDLTGE